MKNFIVLFFITLLSIFSCRDNHENPLTLINNEAIPSLAMTQLEDINESKNIVEVNLTADVIEHSLIAGTTTSMYAYNGSYPGPMIKAKLGDRLIVNFTNNLPEETTVHWHGLELPANMDGSHISQLPVPANGGTFRYEFVLNRASLFWFHPHIRTNEQIEKGLFGTLLVEDTNENQTFHFPEKQSVLVFDDILLDENNQVASFDIQDPLVKAKTALDGRIGNFLLVNGQYFPVVNINNGEPIRLRLLNISNSRFMRISIAGVNMYRIGGDAGLISETELHEPIETVIDPTNPFNTVSDPDINKGITLTPGERADIIITPIGEDGEALELQWHDLKRGRHAPHYLPDGNIDIAASPDDGRQGKIAMMLFRLQGEAQQTTEMIPDTFLTPTDWVQVDEYTPKLPVMFGHSLPDQQGNIMFFASMKNGMGIPFMNLGPEDGLSATVGNTYIWEVTNMTAGIHPFHTHGFAFMHLQTEFVDMDNPENNYVLPAEKAEWKDTIMIPARPSFQRGRSRTISRFAVTFDDFGREGQVEAFGKVPTETTSGGWLVHCHVLEHARGGMMTFLNLRY